MSKLPTIKNLEKHLTKLVYYCVFARDDSRCQVCSKRVGGQSRHPSHVEPKSHSRWLRWDIQNIKTLCFNHHMQWWHLKPREAGRWFDSKFPDRAKYIDENKHKSWKDEVRKMGMTQREWFEKEIEKYEKMLLEYGYTLESGV